jgi:hypothetical protein
MDTVSPVVRRFFEEFGRAAKALDVDRILAQFADPFLHADPGGTRAIGHADFPAILERRRALFGPLGLRESATIPLEETPLDDRYTLVRTRVSMRFERPGGQDIEVHQDATFLLSSYQNLPKIIMYMNHQDLSSVLRGAGLVPA